MGLVDPPGGGPGWVPSARRSPPLQTFATFSGPRTIRLLTKTFTKSARAKIDAAPLRQSNFARNFMFCEMSIFECFR
jgi:hypothetical protein